MWPFQGRGKRNARAGVPVETALKELQTIGIDLRATVPLSSLLRELKCNVSDPVDPIHLLCTLGDAVSGLDGAYYSDDVFYFDAECIENTGDYRRLALRLTALAKGDLPIAEPKDFVDVVAGEAWLEFSFRDVPTRWDFVVNDDWVDASLFTHFQQLLAEVGSPLRYRSATLGQDSLLFCGRENLGKDLEAFVGAPLQWWKGLAD